jgi:uncharacterized protein DUF3450
MTCISNNKIAAVAAGLLALAAANTGAPQQAAGGDRYARALADADITARYNATIEQQLTSQQGEIASLEAQIAGLDATAVEVQSLLQRMFDELVAFVANDVPFFKEQRDARIQVLRELMANVEATASEKYRRLVEAYQIELEYGRTMSAYKQALPDGREAELVRLGRVSLLYRTVDGAETGYWDNDSKAWVEDADSAAAILEALRIAKEETAADLIRVPVPAPKGGRS